jgi:transketolase
MTWYPYVGDAGRIVGLNHYGASAAFAVLYEQFGLTDEAVVAAARESLEAARSGTAAPTPPPPSSGGLPFAGNH